MGLYISLFIVYPNHCFWIEKCVSHTEAARIFDYYASRGWLLQARFTYTH